TKGSHERVRQLMTARGISEDRFSIRAVAPREMPSYLAAGDVGVAFIKRCFSKLASSPTKNGEYLACGLPIVINAGIGDSDSLVDQSHAGILIDDFDDRDFDLALVEIEKLIDDPNIKRRRVQWRKNCLTSTLSAPKLTHGCTELGCKMTCHKQAHKMCLWFVPFCGLCLCLL